MLAIRTVLGDLMDIDRTIAGVRRRARAQPVRSVRLFALDVRQVELRGVLQVFERDGEELILVLDVDVLIADNSREV